VWSHGSSAPPAWTIVRACFEGKQCSKSSQGTPSKQNSLSGQSHRVTISTACTHDTENCKSSHHITSKENSLPHGQPHSVTAACVCDQKQGWKRVTGRVAPSTLRICCCLLAQKRHPRFKKISGSSGGDGPQRQTQNQWKIQ
jgi:hypothetical protein